MAGLSSDLEDFVDGSSSVRSVDAWRFTAGVGRMLLLPSLDVVGATDIIGLFRSWVIIFGG